MCMYTYNVHVFLLIYIRIHIYMYICMCLEVPYLLGAQVLVLDLWLSEWPGRPDRSPALETVLPFSGLLFRNLC